MTADGSGAMSRYSISSHKSGTRVEGAPMRRQSPEMSWVADPGKGWWEEGEELGN